MTRALDEAMTARLLAAAHQSYDRAYCPYSHFPVGAAIVTTSGAVYAGSNVENAAYPLGSCAEASAISAMVSDGQTGPLTGVLVLGGRPGQNQLCTPCGGCRQRLREFALEDMPCLIYGLDHDLTPVLRLTTRLDDLLPHSFGPNNLNQA